MNSYTLEHDSHSVFLRQRSNYELARKLDKIRNRKNLFLFESRQMPTSPNRKSFNIFDHRKRDNLEKEYEIKLRNRVIGENLSKIQKQQNKYLCFETAKKQSVSRTVLRKIEQDRIRLENSKIGQRINRV